MRVPREVRGTNLTRGTERPLGNPASPRGGGMASFRRTRRTRFLRPPETGHTPRGALGFKATRRFRRPPKTGHTPPPGNGVPQRSLSFPGKIRSPHFCREHSKPWGERARQKVPRKSDLAAYPGGLGTHSRTGFSRGSEPGVAVPRVRNWPYPQGGLRI